MHSSEYVSTDDNIIIDYPNESTLQILNEQVHVIFGYSRLLTVSNSLFVVLFVFFMWHSHSRFYYLFLFFILFFLPKNKNEITILSEYAEIERNFTNIDTIEQYTKGLNPERYRLSELPLLKSLNLNSQLNS